MPIPTGSLLTGDAWEARKETMLPSADDNRVHREPDAAGAAPGAFASWIAPPRIGIDNRPGDFEYVKIEA